MNQEKNIVPEEANTKKEAPGGISGTNIVQFSRDLPSSSSDKEPSQNECNLPDTFEEGKCDAEVSRFFESGNQEEDSLDNDIEQLQRDIYRQHGFTILSKPLIKKQTRDDDQTSSLFTSSKKKSQASIDTSNYKCSNEIACTEDINSATSTIPDTSPTYKSETNPKNEPSSTDYNTEYNDNIPEIQNVPPALQKEGTLNVSMYTTNDSKSITDSALSNSTNDKSLANSSSLFSISTFENSVLGRLAGKLKDISNLNKKPFRSKYKKTFYREPEDHAAKLELIVQMCKLLGSHGTPTYCLLRSLDDLSSFLDIEATFAAFPNYVLAFFHETEAFAGRVELVGLALKYNMRTLSSLVGVYKSVLLGNLGPIGALNRIIEIINRPTMYGADVKVLCAGMSSLCVSAIAYKGGFNELVASFFSGIFVYVLLKFFSKVKSSWNLTYFLTPFIVGFFSSSLKKYACFESIALSAMSAILPGLFMTTGFIEIIGKTLVSGTSKLQGTLQTLATVSIRNADILPCLLPCFKTRSGGGICNYNLFSVDRHSFKPCWKMVWNNALDSNHSISIINRS
ncbi:hypothetical protein BB560_001909 [Smittium megazygosporum]|uniref:Threonine/serine exporter-like N-terminal domain-containing protein n=1 Tax=Smittium megazygosporum TaxID=133381 RepID=A0A2T9ZG85_9FUNG|nr:hypothetical protein BB560_001909 [Smittium megazygosporum]